MPSDPKLNHPKTKTPPSTHRDVSEVLDEQEMDDTLDDTFPASDPPSWTFGVDEDRKEQPASDDVADAGKQKSGD